MWTAIVTILLTFLLTSVLGNFFVHAWQHQNWLIQRRILETEAQYEALQKTFDEVSDLAGKRQHRMFRLLSSLLHDGDDTIGKRLADYDEATALWNERLAGMFARLTMHLNYGFTRQLERRIQPRFVGIDSALSKLTSARLSGARVSRVDAARLSQSLSVLHGQIVTFNRDALKQIDRQKRDLYRPRTFSRYTLDSFPTWELFKALFKPRIERRDVF